MMPVITNIIKKTLTSGVVPPEFKEAFVSPLLKKNDLDTNIPKNYHPLSNFLSKFLERIVLKQNTWRQTTLTKSYSVPIKLNIVLKQLS
jgi:hypothetical protein